MCVWFPMWSLTRPDAPSDEPVLIVDDRVTGATGEVLEAGVTLGMPRREAEALAPFAKVMVRDVGEEARRFEPVVSLVEDLVPRVEVVSPGLIFVPVDGAVRYYGGEETLARRVDEAIEAHFEDAPAPDAQNLSPAGVDENLTLDSQPDPRDLSSAGGSERSERRGVVPPQIHLNA